RCVQLAAIDGVGACVTDSAGCDVRNSAFFSGRSDTDRSNGCTTRKIAVGNAVEACVCSAYGIIGCRTITQSDRTRVRGGCAPPDCNRIGGRTLCPRSQCKRIGSTAPRPGAQCNRARGSAPCSSTQSNSLLLQCDGATTLCTGF